MSAVFILEKCTLLQLYKQQRRNETSVVPNTANDDCSARIRASTQRNMTPQAAASCSQQATTLVKSPMFRRSERFQGHRDARGTVPEQQRWERRMVSALAEAGSIVSAG